MIYRITEQLMKIMVMINQQNNNAQIDKGYNYNINDNMDVNNNIPVNYMQNDFDI